MGKLQHAPRVDGTLDTRPAQLEGRPDLRTCRAHNTMLRDGPGSSGGAPAARRRLAAIGGHIGGDIGQSQLQGLLTQGVPGVPRTPWHRIEDPLDLLKRGKAPLETLPH